MKSLDQQERPTHNTFYTKIKRLAVGHDVVHLSGVKDDGSLWRKLAARIFGHEITNYGFNRLVKAHLDWYRWLPLSVEIHHGWYLRQAPRVVDLKKNIPAILVFNERQALAWRAVNGIPAFVLGAPFVHYRRHKGFTQSSQARGTVVFPVHSGSVVDVEFDIDSYCAELSALPARFHPINICLHDDDIRKKRHKAYLARGFSVYSAGSRRDPDFADNFYSILSEHEYSTSNGAGSYVLYSVEMGIPFFLYGPKAESTHQVFDGFESEPVLQRFNQLFEGVSDEITEAQRVFITSEIGVEQSVSAQVLRAKLQWLILIHPIRKLFKKVFKC